jgi:hypothetical protein
MKTVLVLLVLSLSIAVLAEHDHSEHLDKKFISSEAKRVAWLRLPDLLKALEDYTTALRSLEGKFSDWFEHDDPTKKERLDETWTMHFAPKYRDTHDRVFVISHVCLDIYGDEKCKLPDDIWNDKYDKRGEAFRKEFI